MSEPRDLDDILDDRRHLVYVSDGTSGSEKVGRLLNDIEPLVAEMKRLHTWDGIMSLLDEHYPTDIFPHFVGQSDHPDRDPGPRILSLIREVDRLRAAAAGRRTSPTRR